MSVSAGGVRRDDCHTASDDTEAIYDTDVDMTPELAAALPILLGIFLLASIIQSAAGFGFGLFSVAALSLFVELKVSTPLLAIVNAPVILYVLWRLRRHIVSGDLGPIILGMLAGIPFGTLVLVNWPSEILLRVLAVVLLVAAYRSLRANNGTACEPATTAPACTLSKLSAAGVGAAMGALAGAFNTGGPPVIAYVYCRPWTKEQRTATLQAIFAISVLVRIVAYAAWGLYDTALVTTAMVCLPSTLAGMFVGYALFRRFPPRALEIFVAVFLAFVAVKLLIWT